MRLLKFILSFSLYMCTFFGDYIVFKSKYSESFTYRAICDTSVHGVIGLLSATLFFSHKLNVPTQECIYYILFCTVMSSLIDIDHFFVAKSVYLKDLTNLKQRGVFHCTTFWLIITILLFSYSYANKKITLFTITFMLVIAYMSHHIRDGNRRGLWMYPFGSTPPINKHVYALLLALLPNILAIIYGYIKRDFKDVEYMIV